MLLSLRVLIALVLALLIGFEIAMARLPPWIGLLYSSAGIIAIIVYRRDKRAAEAGVWRVPEVNLHLIDLLFGIVGGLLAQQLFRHKTRKLPFAVITWLIATLHLAMLIAIATGLIDIDQLMAF